jgi:hypothetical protein
MAMTSFARPRACTLLLALSLGLSSELFAQTAPPASQARSTSLTQSLAALGARYDGEETDRRPAVLRQMLAEAAERHDLLASTIERDPGFVLQVALPDAMRQQLPASVRDYVEQHVEIEGAVEILQEDYVSGARLRHYLHTAGGRLLMNYVERAPSLQTGDRVRVRGVALDGALALEPGNTSVIAALTALPNTMGEQRTLVLLVNFQDDTSQPYTTAEAQHVVFTTTSDYDREASFQRTWLTGDVFGWYTIPMSRTVCDSATLATQAKQAATAAGINLAAYSRYVFGFPENACTWWGLGSVGGNPSQAWINGDFVLDVVAHEMGHNFGLYHAHSLDCGTSPIAPPCTSSEYGDTLDMMGGARGHFSAFMKERLGWLGEAGAPAITTVSTNGTYVLEPFESPSAGGAKALKILKSIDATTGARTWYYVELRQPIGFDSFLAGSTNVPNGVVIRTGSEATANSHYLLDMTPETPSWYDPALVVGRTFTDATAGVTLTAVSAGSAGASVAVTLSGATCSRGNPTVSLSPSQSQWLVAGAAATYTVSVTSTDSAACPTAGFDLTSAAPAGWTVSFGSPTVTAAPGASASTTMVVVSTPTAANGFYAVTARATHAADGTKTRAASATYVVISTLGVQVSSARTTYSRNQTVQLTTTVSGGSAPAAGATVVFTVTRPGGAVTTRTTTADGAGVASYSWRVVAKDPVGTYQVSLTASLNGASGSGATSFAVTK